jgi:ankyrin repeat protein
LPQDKSVLNATKPPNNFTALDYAVKSGRIDMMDLLFDVGCEIQDASRIMHLASYTGSVDVVRALKSRLGESYDSLLSDALATATAKGNVSAMRCLLSAGAPPSSRLVEMALLGGHAAAVDALVEAGAELNLRASETLRLACEGDCVDVVKRILAAGRPRESTVESCLHDAICSGKPAVAKLLAALRMVDIALTPQFFRCATGSRLGEDEEGYLGITKLLLDNRVSVNAEDDLGRTFLVDAVQARCPRIVQFLLRSRAGVNIPSERDFEEPGQLTPLCVSHDPGITRTLLRAKAKVNQPNTQPTLMGACQAFSTETVKMLLGAKAAPDGNPSGRFPTPLYYAVTSPVAGREGAEIVGVLSKLLDAGARTRNVYEGRSALHCCCSQDDDGAAAQMARLLLARDRGLLELPEPSLRLTPLRLAVRKRRAGVARVLVEAGANRAALSEGERGQLQSLLAGEEVEEVEEEVEEVEEEDYGEDFEEDAYSDEDEEISWGEEEEEAIPVEVPVGVEADDEAEEEAEEEAAVAVAVAVAGPPSRVRKHEEEAEEEKVAKKARV